MLLTVEAWRLGGTLLDDAVVCEQRRLLLAPTDAHQRDPAESPGGHEGKGDREPSSPAGPVVATGGYSSTVLGTTWRVTATVPLSVPWSPSHTPSVTAQNLFVTELFPFRWLLAKFPKLVSLIRAISWVFGIGSVTLWPSSTGLVPQFMHLSLISHLKNTVQFPAVI